MHPVLLEIGPLKIYSFGLCVALAFIIAAHLAKKQAERSNYNPDRIMNLLLGIAISGILGGRLFYILLNLDFYMRFPGQMIMLHKGGLSFYGGLILSIVFALVFLKIKKMSVLKTFDLICPYVALAQAIGRIGCLLNGCCYGKPAGSALAVYLPGENIIRYPVQLYSSLSLLLIFIILRKFQDGKAAKDEFAGRVFLLYCLLYSLMRFFMEYLRGDNLTVFANLTVHQLISAAIFLTAGLVWLKKWRV